MATIAKGSVKARQFPITNTSPPTIRLKEAASQTFIKGELVFINAGGYVAEIASDTPSAIYGVAAENASNDATDGLSEVTVTLADPTVFFSMNLLETGLVDHVLAQTDLGQPAAIQRDTVNSFVYVDISTNAGANVRVFVHTYDSVADGGRNGTQIGDTNGRVLVTFLPNWVQYLGTS